MTKEKRQKWIKQVFGTKSYCYKNKMFCFDNKPSLLFICYNDSFGTKRVSQQNVYNILWHISGNMVISHAGQ